MKRKNVGLIFLTITVSLCSGYFIGHENPANAQIKRDSRTDLFNILRNRNISVVRRYEVDQENETFAIQSNLDKPFDKDPRIKTSEQLAIYDKSGKEIFSKIDLHIADFYFAHLTRSSSQLVIVTNGGGTDNFLEVYDERDGKFVAIIDPFETQIRGGYWIVPEYRTGMTSPYGKPSQIFVIGQIGGMDENPSATVFRYKGGIYKSVGEIKMQELGDFIERKLSKK